ncbi:MAG: AAA family ATPase, partial [Pirellulaceae bacterium]
FGYTRPNRPMAVLLFLGNSGTGKTQLAKEIAQAMYGSEDQLIFLEMGQFGDKHAKNIFIGAPPGYVGYGEGLLTNGLRDKPESVVLFDEVEKADRIVFDVLLRFLDEGKIADPAGPVRDGRRCVIVLTSNHALDMLQPLIDRQSEAKHLPRAEREAAKMEVRNEILATGFFRPEFINRVDEIILFNTFDADAYRKIVHYLLETECQRLNKEKSLDFTVDDSLQDELVRQCVARSGEGARVCLKLVGEIVIAALIDYFLDPDHEGVQSVHLSFSEAGHIQITPQDR